MRNKKQNIVKKEAKKLFKKAPFLLLLVVVIVCAIAFYLHYQKEKNNVSGFLTKGGVLYLASEGTAVDKVDITFLALLGTDQNPQIGDSIFIECGDIDILIDAGEKASGSNTVVPFIEEHVTDDILELVIITHADSDHLGGMVGLSTSYGALDVPNIDYKYIVDFGYEGTTQLYEDYLEIRNQKEELGTNYINIASCFNQSNPNAITRFYLGDNTYLDLLDYQTYGMNEITDDNDRSVSCLLTCENRKVLLCGDAEKEEETYLTNLNIGHVDVFKANHHGSPTSNTTAFLNNITPEYVIISSSAENKYNLPKKTIVARLNTYTKKLFATFINGTIVVTIENNDIKIQTERGLEYVQDSTWYLNDNPENPR